MLQQLQGQVAALTARVAEQDATIGALRARPPPPPKLLPSSVAVRAEAPEVDCPACYGSSPAAAAPAATRTEVEVETVFNLTSCDSTDEEDGEEQSDLSLVLHSTDDELHLEDGPDLAAVDGAAAHAVGAVEYSEDPCELSLEPTCSATPCPTPYVIHCRFDDIPRIVYEPVDDVEDDGTLDAVPERPSPTTAPHPNHGSVTGTAWSCDVVLACAGRPCHRDDV